MMLPSLLSSRSARPHGRRAVSFGEFGASQTVGKPDPCILVFGREWLRCSLRRSRPFQLLKLQLRPRLVHDRELMSTQLFALLNRRRDCIDLGSVRRQHPMRCDGETASIGEHPTNQPILTTGPAECSGRRNTEEAVVQSA